MNKPLLIFGSSEMAEMAKFYFENDSGYQVIGFTVDDDFITSDHFQGLPLIPFSELKQRYHPDDYEMHVALSYVRLNQLRQEKYEQVKKAGYRLASYVSSKSATWPDLTFGDNCFILENQTIQPKVYIGNNVMLWSGNHIGHSSVIENHVYMASHVVVSGHCRIGERSFIGVNATLRDFCNIGKDCFIGMGADVVRDIPDRFVAMAAASDILGENEPRVKALRKNYLKFEK